MSTFRKHEATAIAEYWLAGEPCRNPDEMYGEQRMAAYLLLAIGEIERLTRERDEAKAVLAQIRQSFLDYAAEKARKPCQP